ncbi:MAG: transketolase family protein [Myxococcales bacterium]|nr:transketolase family protein [Myxococcales bacterium]
MTNAPTRQSFSAALAERGPQYPEVVVLDADLSKSTKSELFRKACPDRFFQMGICEQNMIGAAAGLAMSGKTAFCFSFACFVAGRFETIKISVAYGGANVKIIGTHAGVGVGADGYSQMSLEDIALMRSLPAMRVYQPADDIEAAALCEHLCRTPGPAYVRLTRQNVPTIHADGYVFRDGELDELRSGTDLALFGTGATSAECLKAADRLGDSQGLSVAVVNVPSIKPIDVDGIASWAKRVPLIVTVEDHNVLAGMGSAVAEVLAEVGGARLLRHGVHDAFGESGSAAELYRKHRLDADGIAEVAVAARTR